MQVRQNYGVTIDRGFKPTSNARLAATFAETKRFADALRKFDKQCSAHLKEVKGKLSAHQVACIVSLACLCWQTTVLTPDLPAKLSAIRPLSIDLMLPNKSLSHLN
jgi:hypothetical protein